MSVTAQQKITTFLMFEGDAERAMRFYTTLFERSEIVAISRYGSDEAGPEGTVKHATFSLAGQEIMCIDSPASHGFGFTPAMSLFVQCDTTEEIERLHAALTEGARSSCPWTRTASAPGLPGSTTASASRGS